MMLELWSILMGLSIRAMLMLYHLEPQQSCSSRNPYNRNKSNYSQNLEVYLYSQGRPTLSGNMESNIRGRTSQPSNSRIIKLQPHLSSTVEGLYYSKSQNNYFNRLIKERYSSSTSTRVQPSFKYTGILNTTTPSSYSGPQEFPLPSEMSSHHEITILINIPK